MSQTLPGPAALFSACPVYVGGKRKLAPALYDVIGKAIGKPPPQATIIDAFAGACSMSLYGKALGYRVIANDLGPRSEAIGKALVENSRVQLNDEDVQIALSTEPVGRYMPPVDQLMWPDDAREVVAGIVAASELYEVPEKRWLLRALAVKTALAISRWGLPRMTVGKKAREGRYDDLTTGQARTLHYLVEPRKVALTQAETMKGVVFTNGQRNEMHCEDALDLLLRTKADAVYFDPPYPGTMSYEQEYVGLDALLQNEEISPKTSRFSAPQGYRFIEELFQASEHIPVWVLSLGNEVVDIDVLVEMASGHDRQVQSRTMDYAHIQSLATADKTAGNQEYVIIATKR